MVHWITNNGIINNGITNNKQWIQTCCLTLLIFLGSNSKLLAEPYFAVDQGLDCSSCHADPSGGGMRNTYGNIFAQRQLPANNLTEYFSGNEPWTGKLVEPLSIGANARFSGRQLDIDDQDSSFAFGTDRVDIYLLAEVIPQLSLYIDQQVAPSGSLNKQAWLKLQLSDQFYVKVGKIMQPFGWRLEDDTAFTRSLTGINFNNTDNGVEFGYHNNNFVSQVSITNGAAGGAETNDEKQFSARISYIEQHWQVGISSNFNDGDSGERTMYGVFAGISTGPITWLAEFDQVEDEDNAGIEVTQQIILFEANTQIAKGHNIKLTVETLDFDEGNFEERQRYSVLWEFFPYPFTQTRIGYRDNDSDDSNSLFSANEFFIQLHTFF